MLSSGVRQNDKHEDFLLPFGNSKRKIVQIVKTKEFYHTQKKISYEKKKRSIGFRTSLV